MLDELFVKPGNSFFSFTVNGNSSIFTDFKPLIAIFILTISVLLLPYSNFRLVKR